MNFFVYIYIVGKPKIQQREREKVVMLLSIYVQLFRHNQYIIYIDATIPYILYIYIYIEVYPL